VKVIGWRAWYPGGQVFSSIDTRFEDLPSDGVQVIMLYHADGTRRVMQGNDYYWRVRSDFGLIYGHANEFDPARYPHATVIRGKWTSDEDLAVIEREAMGARVL
jgi:hypothetical protein